MVVLSKILAMHLILFSIQFNSLFSCSRCVFPTWTILQLEMDSNFKKMSRGRRGVHFIPPRGEG